MKRLREESYVGPQFKRPCPASTAESHGQPQNTAAVGGGGGQKLTTDDALQYLKLVKEVFPGQREKYDHFLEAMKDFKAHRTDTLGVISRVKELFKGHNNLISGFNTFLPKGFEITIDDEEPLPQKKAVEFEEAINFVNKIKKRFQNDDQVYKSFLEILNMYRKEHKNISEVYDEVYQLFEDHSDLLEEFTRFLPDNSSSATLHHSKHARTNLQRYDERSSAVPISRPMDMDKQRWRSRDRVNASHCDHDLIGERKDMDEGRLTMKAHKVHRNRDTDNNGDRRNCDVDSREADHDNKRDSSVQVSEKKKPSRKVEGFKTNSALASSEDKISIKRMYNREFTFCEKVKEKLGSDNYQAFLKCLHIYSTEIISRSELKNLVADLLGKYPDLMEGFREFLEHCENIDAVLAGLMNKKTLLSDGPSSRQVKADEKDKGPKREIDPAKEKLNNDYSSKSIQELDLSNCERCSPSYRLLPSDYPIPMASQRSDIGARVLNDHWVSVTSGSEDYSFKQMRRNQFEETLFRCEDDRFELDMLLESVSSTAKKAEDLLDIINDSSVNVDGPIHIEDHFTPLNLRCIERLYGDHCLDVMDLLRKNPATSLPVILIRLKQKQEEWTKCRADVNKVWAGIYTKNHFKSLDHRSFYFKQNDSKKLSTKSLVAEIKEMKEKLQKEDDMLLAVAAGNKRPLVPHFKFEYLESDIHEDLFKLIKFSCEEVCSTKEQLNKVIRLWTTFLEPLLGFKSRAHGVDNDKDYKPRQKPSRDGVIPEIGERQPTLIVNGLESSVGNVSKSHKTNRELNALNAAAVADRTLERLPSSSGSSSKNLESHHCISNTESTSGSQAIPLRQNSGAEDEQEPKSTTEAFQPQSEAADALASLTSGTFTQCSKANQNLDKTVSRSNVDQKEGEFSLKGDVDEENITASGGKVKQSGNIYKQHSEENMHHGDEIIEDVEAENDADDEDSENDASEGGVDLSGSESAGDECSREEHEEQEDAEHGELEGKAESEGKAEVHYFSGDVSTVPLSERFLLSVKPLAKYLPLSSQDANQKDIQVFYGNDDFYALFRLHRMLFERMVTVKMNSTCPESKWRNSKDPSHVDPYASFLAALYHLLDGSSDNAKFEDDCRSIIGNQSYVLFTLDKLIYKLVKQLQVVATDEMESKLLQLYEYERSRKPRKFIDSVYHENARVLLHEDNIYRFEFSSSPNCMSVQLMDNWNEKPEMVAVSIEPNFAAYLFNDFLSLVSARKEPSGIILQRNKNKYADLDESSASSEAMDGVLLSNGLECKLTCSSSKISYVLDTEDFFFRPKRGRKNLPANFPRRLNEARAHRFNRFLSVACR